MNKKPLLTKSISAYLVQSFGDMLAQCVETGGVKNKRRLLIQGCYGAFYLAPVLHMWLGTLARVFPQPGTRTVLKKLAVDLTLFNCFIQSSFLFIISSVNEMSIEKGKETWRLKIYDAVSNSFKYWPFIQFVNFSYVPVHYQVIVISFASVFWAGYMSLTRARAINK